MEWIADEPDAELCHAAARTADAALRQGQLELTGTERRFDTDLLGTVLATLKTRTASGAHAQIYTPAPIADVIARMTPPRDGDTVQDPALGSGGLFRAAAQAMRAEGRDPTTVTWVGADIDPLAVAAAAINSLVWNLGPNMVLCVANTLTEPEWITRAQTERDELIQLARGIRRDKAVIEAIRTAHIWADIAANGDTPSHDETAPDSQQ